MKVACNTSILLCVVVLSALWTTPTCAASEEIPPFLASYNYGVAGEPAKIDTAFGNLGEGGPSYDVPSKNRTSGINPSPMPENQEGVISQNQTSQSTEELQDTNTGSNSTSPIQSFNTGTSDKPASAATSSTTEKSIVPNTTPETALNGSASTAGDRGTTAPIDVSPAETEFPMESATNATSTPIPSAQSVSPNQTFETGKPTRIPTAGPIGNATKPGQQNGTVTAEPNSSIAVQPLTTITYSLGCIVLLISKTMY